MKKVLVIDDNEDYFHLIDDLLNALHDDAYDVRWAGSYPEARDVVEANRFDAILIDHCLGPDEGVGLLEEFQASGQSAPLIVCTGQGDEELAALAIKRGARDYLTKRNLTGDVLRRSIAHAIEANELERELQQLQQQYEREAHEDSLLGIPNRRAFMRRLDDEFARAARHRHNLALLLIDLDHFKHVNDRFGHPVGDRVLVTTTRQIVDSVRQIDLVGRYGGEELIVMLPETDLAGAELLAERIRSAIAGFRHWIAGHRVAITVSIGVAVRHLTDFTSERTIHRADQALYHAKHSGRNRVATEAALVPIADGIAEQPF